MTYFNMKCSKYIVILQKNVIFYHNHLSNDIFMIKLWNEEVSEWKRKY